MGLLSIYRKSFPHLIIQVLKGFSYRGTTLFLISSVRWKRCSEVSLETWGTAPKGEASGIAIHCGKHFPSGCSLPFAAPFFQVGAQLLVPSVPSRRGCSAPHPEIPFLQTGRATGSRAVQMLGCGKQMAGSCSWHDSLGCSANRSPEEILCRVFRNTDGSSDRWNNTAGSKGSRKGSVLLLGCGPEAQGHSD